MDNQVEISKNDSLIRGEAFNQMVRSDGWKFVKKYFETKLQTLATRLLIEDKKIEDYEAERQKLIGLRELFGFIDNDIKILDDESKKPTETTGK